MMDKQHCKGCRHDHYNTPHSQCWSGDSAKLIKRVLVPADRRPPWTQAPQMLPSCFRKEGYVCVAPDNPSCKVPADAEA